MHRIQNLAAAILLTMILLICLSTKAFSSQDDLNYLKNLELHIFNQSFDQDNINNRLNRIEENIFGQKSNGNETQRLNRLRSLAANYNRESPQQENIEPDVQADTSATDYPVVTQMELKTFNQNFARENIYTRLNRLEEKLFGTMFTNASLSDRVDKLKSVIPIVTPNSRTRISDDIENSKGSVYSNVTALEFRLLGMNYENELISQRLERLEIKAFGAVQTGTVDDRIDRLNTIAQNQNQNNYSGQSSPTNLAGMSSGNSTEWNSTYNNIPPPTQTTGLLDFVERVLLPFVVNIFTGGYTSQYQNPQQYQNYPYNPQNYNNQYGTNYNGQYNQWNNLGAGVRVIP